MNHAQLVGTQDGCLPTYKQVEFFNAHFRQWALKGIKAMHNLNFTHLKQGTVIIKDSLTSPEREREIWQPPEVWPFSSTGTLTQTEAIPPWQNQRKFKECSMTGDLVYLSQLKKWWQLCSWRHFRKDSTSSLLLLPSRTIRRSVAKGTTESRKFQRKSKGQV